MTLSIITINLNNLEGLKKTCSSIQSQSWRDYEWIVIDGGSIDGSREFIEERSKDIAWWCSEKDSGVFNAMNKGIAKATGDYLLFLNSGDAFHSADILQQVFAVRHTEDILYGDAVFVKPKHSFRWCYAEKLTLRGLYDYSINHQSTFIRTWLLKERGYDESYRLTADWKRFVEWFVEGKTFVHLPYIISDYDTTGMSTVNEDKTHEERDRFFSEFYDKEVVELLKEWLSFQTKPCRQTKVYCEESKLYKKIIRANLHFITWMNAFLHFSKCVR